MSVKGKVALVTGAGTGIGKATTEHMRAAGAHVVAGFFTEAERSPTSSFPRRLLDV
ncbi:uncharacterized protein METZ01_LOCUS176416, partial [marine metagenome]